MLIASDLSYSLHYSHITARAYRALGLLRKTFSSSTGIHGKKTLYISLVRSQLMYCSVLWRPHWLRDIDLLECVQRRATKYILNDYSSDYKNHLIQLGMLPLMYIFELQDILFTVANLKSSHKDFVLADYVHFSSQDTRSSAGMKMTHHYAPTNSSRHFFYNRIPRLWNSMPPMDLQQSTATIKHQLRDFLFNHFKENFLASSTCSFHFHCPCARCGHSFHPPTFLC